jgi:hypothetical protein
VQSGGAVADIACIRPHSAPTDPFIRDLYPIPSGRVGRQYGGRGVQGVAARVPMPLDQGLIGDPAATSGEFPLPRYAPASLAGVRARMYCRASASYARQRESPGSARHRRGQVLLGSPVQGPTRVLKGESAHAQISGCGALPAVTCHRRVKSGEA